MLHKIDQSDLIKTGSFAKEFIPTTPNGDQKFAVIIKTAKAKIPKFNITTKEDVCNALVALEKNAEDIPLKLRESAEYFIKSAADHFNIPNNIQSISPMPHTVNIEDIKFKKATKSNYSLNINGRHFYIETPTQLKIAEKHFLSVCPNLSIKNRAKIAMVLSAQAFGTDFSLSPDTAAYAFPLIKSGAIEQISIRKDIFKDTHLSLLNKIASVLESYEPTDFVEQIRTLDKVANYNPEKIGVSYAEFFKESATRPKEAKRELTKIEKVS